MYCSNCKASGFSDCRIFRFYSKNKSALEMKFCYSIECVMRQCLRKDALTIMILYLLFPIFCNLICYAIAYFVRGDEEKPIPSHWVKCGITTVLEIVLLFIIFRCGQPAVCSRSAARHAAARWLGNGVFQTEHHLQPAELSAESGMDCRCRVCAGELCVSLHQLHHPSGNNGFGAVTGGN